MKLLVLAQTSPPLHGQSFMTRELVAGLARRGFPAESVDLHLSRTGADIGRWHAGKLLPILDACGQAIALRLTGRGDTLYYIPAPGKRGALYRDWLVLALCRPFFPRLVLHWHAVGLGDWLATRATGFERRVTRLLLGGADLSLVLTPSLAADAKALAPRRIAVVPNGIPDEGEPVAAPRSRNVFRILFLGALTEEKGVGTLLAAGALLRQRGIPAVLVFAGEALDPGLRARLAGAPHVELPGFVTGARKAELFATSHCICLPTHYRNEAQPLVALEALAADRPLVVTAWRGLPETVPPSVPVVPPRDPAALADALAQVWANPPPAQVHRRYFLSHYTVERHLDAVIAALRG